MNKTRIEKDSLGAVEVPSGALYGAQTQRAIDNFVISGEAMPKAFIQALLLVKAAAAKANIRLDALPADIGNAIVQAAERLQADNQIMQHFPIDIFQTGSATSTNMNANEVLATLASKELQKTVHANDHVNCSQSSNDVIPTTIHVSTHLAITQSLLPAMQHLAHVIHHKAGSLEGVVKTGRTHLMDAMPVRFSQVMGGWANQIEQNIELLNALQPRLQQLAQGGTAVGTGVNAPNGFAEVFCEELSVISGQAFRPADNFFAQMASQDTAVAVSAQLRGLAVTVMKIANDLRWMNSGPLAGLGEIQLPALQPGSSIMPGKVNPVIPESAAMVAAQVMGNDTAVMVAGQSGNFELNVMLPVVASNLLKSVGLLTNTCMALADKAIKGFEVNSKQIEQALYRNPVLVTALNTMIGYEKSAAIARQAYEEGRAIIDVALEKTAIDEQVLRQLLDPLSLTGDNKT